MSHVTYFKQNYNVESIEVIGLLVGARNNNLMRTNKSVRCTANGVRYGKFYSFTPNSSKIKICNLYSTVVLYTERNSEIPTYSTLDSFPCPAAPLGPKIFCLQFCIV
uniref:Uncharacterized protein n=1 Tax=Cacopsylla melanoneura TaxID=428564 RepID=A0A8D8W1E0_9HEMI